MLRLVAFALALALTAVPLRAQDDSSEWEARLTQAKGEVTVYTSEAPEGLPAEEDMPLEAGDRISTGQDGTAEVALGEGAHLIVLRGGSDFTLTSVRKDAAELKLGLGSLLAKISKLAAAHRFSVRTPVAVAAVRGTEFAVELPADKPEETVVGVFDEGKVEVTGEGEGKELLISNQETTVARGRAPMQAYGLRRLARHRASVRRFKSRGAHLRKHWKAIPPGQRKAMRQKAIGRMAQRRQQRLEKGAAAPRKGGLGKEQLERRRRDKEKREKRKEQIRRGRR